MADLIVAFVLLLGAGSAAELVRSTCRRRLLTPIAARTDSTAPAAGRLTVT
ncbi:MAG TPA: hypothetical protein VKB75_15575 [Jatrophihabitans sp.]|nr:hypothetical protein [Jatrophihabitans sp.]